MRKCPKCGFENAGAIGSITEACPNCGVIYAKAEAAAGAPRSSSPALQPVRQEMRLPLWPTLACIVCLIAGFFIGREQMRYQIASAVTGAFAHAFDGLNKQPPVPGADAPVKSEAPPKVETPVAPPAPQPITAKLVKRVFANKTFRAGTI